MQVKLIIEVDNIKIRVASDGDDNFDYVVLKRVGVSNVSLFGYEVERGNISKQSFSGKNHEEKLYNHQAELDKYLPQYRAAFEKFKKLLILI